MGAARTGPRAMAAKHGMVTPMDEYDRRELAELFAADDRWRAEHEDWLARRAAESIPSPVRETGPDGILYRTTEQTSQSRTPAADAAPRCTMPFTAPVKTSC